MVQFLQKCNFIEHDLFEHGQTYFLDVMSFYYFDGVEIIWVRFWGSQLHFRIKAFSNRFKKLVVLDARLVYGVCADFQAVVIVLFFLVIML